MSTTMSTSPHPEYMDLFYRFPTEAEAREILADYLAPDDSGALQWLTSGDGFALDLIGPLSDVIPSDDPEAEPLILPLPGWHLNLRTWGNHVAPETGRITPDHPRRVWA
ncbi:hypothetical protein OpiT1DRAFT_04751 [Opitutaceae bacterium TAV1]|nr:hypothetical protein OpiT1DRAFT_04751 [Opitutaceae bacterium TAV1]